MVVTPPRAPRTRATRSDEACHAPAAAGSRPAAAPRAAGSVITMIARTPVRVRASVQISRPISPTRATGAALAGGAGTRRNTMGVALARVIAARTRPGADSPTCPAIHRPRPPPSPAPPRLAACVQPAIGPRRAGGVVSAMAAVTEAPVHTAATLTQRHSTPSTGTPAADIGVTA